MFIDTISHLLALVTVSDLEIFDFDYKNQSFLGLYETAMTVFVRALDSLKITAFNETGRICLSSKSDSTNHWQVAY